MKPKELKVGDKVFLVKEPSFLYQDEVQEVAEVTKVTGSSIYIDDTRFPIKATFPLLHRAKNIIDNTQHLWFDEAEYASHQYKLHKVKVTKIKQELQKVSEGLGYLSGNQLDKLSSDLKKLIVIMYDEQGM